MKSLCLIMLAAALVAGCEDKASTNSGASSAAPAATAAPEGSTKPASSSELDDAALDKADVPVEEDFEDEAEKDISTDNMEKELEALDKEIGAE